MMMDCTFFIHHHGIKLMKQIRLTICEIAQLTGLHRQTVSRRLAAVTPLEGSSCKKKIYDLRSALPAIFKSGVHQ